MKLAKYHWLFNEEPVLPEDYLQATAEFKVDPLAAKILWNRGIQEPEAIRKFFQPQVEDLYDPFLMHDMTRAVERMQQAVAEGQRILIYGDYDADGITSTTVMKEALELIGAEVEYFLPNRFLQGYGPNLAVYKEKIAEGVQLIVTVDNGVAGHEAIAYAQSQGVDVIVTDHHELPPTLPEAFAIVHPRHPEGNYPFGDLAGVGVAFKVATALLEEVPQEFFDLVAIGTVADLVSLTDENRILVQFGLQAMRMNERLGLEALLRAADIKKSSLSEESIGFGIGPRLNALGRLGEAGPGVALLSSFDEEEIATIITFIEQQNEARKDLVQTVTAEAMAQALTMTDPILVLAQENWHEGILGIVAGKVLQQTGKPTIVLSVDPEKGTAKGSGRSVAAFNLFDALNSRRELFLHFGGHHMAAGMTLPIEKVAELRQFLSEYVYQEEIDFTQGQELVIDERLQTSEISIPLIETVRKLAPFGTDNQTPNFLIDNVAIKQAKQIGGDLSHLKLVVGDEKLDAIGFSFPNSAQEFSSDAENALVGQLSINEWNGNRKPQLMLQDFAVRGLQLFDWRAKNERPANLLMERTAYIVFNQEHRRAVPENGQIVTPEELSALSWSDFQQFVFVDCPSDPAQLKEIVQQSSLDRFYLLCLSDDAYLNGVGTREQYARLFTFIKQQKQLDVRYKTGQIAQFLKIPEKLLIFMIQVFFDLKFVTIEDGVLTSIEAPANQPLTNSGVYQKRLQQIKSEEFLLYSDIHTLRAWLLTKEENNK